MTSDNKRRPGIGVGVILIKNSRVLLGKRKGAHGAGSWSCPGGHLEFGESVEECASRELAEETGLTALSLCSGPWVNYIDEDEHFVTLFVFVNEFAGELILLEPDKCEGWEWFEWNALPSPLFLPVASLIKKIGIEKLIQMGCREEILNDECLKLESY
jgi:8-oxo-dGTP diphosphatase